MAPQGLVHGRAGPRDRSPQRAGAHPVGLRGRPLRGLLAPQTGCKLLPAPVPWLPARRDAVGCRARPLGRRAGDVG